MVRGLRRSLREYGGKEERCLDSSFLKRGRTRAAQPRWNGWSAGCPRGKGEEGYRARCLGRICLCGEIEFATLLSEKKDVYSCVSWTTKRMTKVQDGKQRWKLVVEYKHSRHTKWGRWARRKFRSCSPDERSDSCLPPDLKLR